MTSVGMLLDGTAPAGIYEASELDVETVLDLARGTDWFAVVVDGEEVTDSLAALREVGRVLGFPSHYGVNLDALADCLWELEDPILLLWTGSVVGLESLIPVLADRVQGDPPFAVVIAATDNKS